MASFSRNHIVGWIYHIFSQYLDTKDSPHIWAIAADIAYQAIKVTETTNSKIIVTELYLNYEEMLIYTFCCIYVCGK